VPGIQTNFANPVDSIQDCDNDGVFTYGSAHNNGGAANTSGRYSSFNPTNFSQMASINADTIFVVYSAIIDGDTSDLSSALEGQNYRDIFVKVSFNGGGSWNQRVNITNSPKVEDVYPSIAKLVDGNLHIVWQSDLEPGTVLTNGDPADPSGSNIIYLSVPTSFVYTHADDGALVCQSPDFGPDAIKDFYTDKNGNPLFTLTPNPATNQVNITGNIADNKMTVTNSLGQVMDLPITKVNNNTATLQVAGLPNGIYYVQIGNAQFKTTTRFVKQ
jgi:hypothetical protein